MRAFVTGAGGFVGGHLVAHLAASEDEVTVLPEGVDIGDQSALCDALTEAAPEAVYHLAALSHVGASFDDPVSFVRVNVGGTAALCEAVRRVGLGGTCRILVVGSSEVYGPVPEQYQPIREESILRPVSPYGASKAAAEIVALQTFRAHGLDVVVTRSFNHTGAGQSTAFVVPAFAVRIAEAVAEGRTEIPVGNLSASRDLLDVEDVVRAYRALAVHGRAGVAYNVCAGTAPKIQEIADRLVAISGAAVRLVTDPALLRPVEVPIVCGSNARLRSDTGWAPTVPLEETLRRVWDDAQRTVGGRP